MIMKKFKKIMALALAVVSVFALAACGNNANNGGSSADSDKAADSDWAYVQGKGKLVIGMTLFAPMDYMDDNGELTGFEVDFGKAVCKKLGVETDFVEINWDAKENELNSKKVDCLWNGLTITPDRKENMSITDAYLANKQVMVTSKDNVEKYGKDITDARVVAETGSAGEELATGNDFFKTAKFTGVDSQAKALMEVKSGTADIAVVDYVTSIGSIGEGTDYTDLAVVTAQEFEPEEYGIAFRKGSDITEKVNAAMKELAADGTLLKIAEKYKLQDLLLIK